MSGFIVLLPALAGLAVPLSLLAGVSFFAASHCPGLERVPLPMRVTVKRAVSGAVFVGILVGLAPTLRECWAGLDNASRVHPYQPATHTIGIAVFINLGPIAAFAGRDLYAHEANRKVFIGKTLRLTNADGAGPGVLMHRYEVRLWGFVAMPEIERKTEVVA